MTDDIKSAMRPVAKLSAGIIVATAAGIFVANQQLAPPAKTVTLSWTNDVGHAWEKYRVTEVQGTTNLRDWYIVTNTTGSRVVLPALKPAEFFRVRNRYTNVSGW